jgi:hypothetical protein
MSSKDKTLILGIVEINFCKLKDTHTHTHTHTHKQTQTHTLKIFIS